MKTYRFASNESCGGGVGRGRAGRMAGAFALFSGAALGIGLLMGCGGNVEVSTGGGGAGGGTGGGVGGVGGSGGTGGSVGGTGGVGGSHCDSGPPSGFSMNIVTPEGAVWDCAAFMESQTGTLSFNAAVVKSDLNLLVVDACSPAADCVPFLYTLQFDAPGLGVFAPIGTYVHVEASVDIPWGCYERLMITNIPSWDGMPNPVQPDNQLWLAATDGAVEMFDDAPFKVDKIKLDCGPTTGGCGGDPGKFDLRFTPVDDPGGAVVVTTAETKTMSLIDTPVAAVKNLRSFESGACDDYWNWAYWVQPSGIK